MVDHLSRYVRWRRYDKRLKTEEPADPPRQVADIILARDGEWYFRNLAGVITAPTMRPDGTLLLSPGYDEATRLVLYDPPRMPPIPLRPSRDEAIAALELIEDLFFEFPFVDEASKSVAVSGLMTTVCRGAMGVAPLHTFRAPVPGSGKSYLVDVICAVQTGQICPVIAAGRTEEETEKRLSSALLQGYPIISVDNLNGELGGDSLCQYVERRVVSIRPLGVSKQIKIESKATILPPATISSPPATSCVASSWALSIRTWRDRSSANSAATPSAW
jgi:putative DNA primase/helicase